jgi:hypothetical protein
MSETMMKASGTSEPVIFLESSTAVAELQREAGRRDEHLGRFRTALGLGAAGPITGKVRGVFNRAGLHGVMFGRAAHRCLGPGG